MSRNLSIQTQHQRDTNRKISINKRQTELIERIVNYVIDPNVYTHKKAEIIYDSDLRKATKKVTAKVFHFENYNRQLKLLRTKLNTLNFSIYEDLIGEEQKSFNEILDKDDLLNSLKKQFHLTLISSNQSVGLDAAHAISSTATQSTLNSFHKAGHLKDTEGSISKLTGTLNASDNVANPRSTIIFKNDSKYKPENFYDILGWKRREYIGVKANKFFRNKEITNPTDLFGITISGKGKNIVDVPEYYFYYEILFDSNISDMIKNARSEMFIDEKLNKTFASLKRRLWDYPDACKKVTMLRYTLDLNTMYEFKTTPKQVCDAINDNSSGYYFAIFSPILYEQIRQISSDNVSPYLDADSSEPEPVKIPVAYIDLYLNVKQMAETLGTEKYNIIERLENSYLHAQAVDSIGGVWVSGIPNIQAVYPDKTEVSSMITGEDFLMKGEGRGSYYNVYFNHSELRYYNVDVPRIVSLFEISGFKNMKSMDNIDEFNDDNVFFIEDEDDLSNLVFVFYSSKSPRNHLIELAEEGEDDSKKYTKTQIKLRDELYNEGKIKESYNLTIFKKPNAFEQINDIHFMKTKGTDLLNVWKRDDVDVNHTYCNDPMLIRNILGHEAARTLSLQDLSNANSFSYIDPRHLMLAVDHMYRQAMVTGFKSKHYENEKVSALSQTIPAKGREIKVMSNRSGLGETTEITSSNDSAMVAGEANLGTTSRNTDILFDYDFKDRIKQRKQEFIKEYPNRIYNDIIEYNDAVSTPNMMVERVGNTLESMSGGLVDTSGIMERDIDENIPESQVAKLVRVAQVVSPYLSRAVNKLPQPDNENIEEISYTKLSEPVWKSNTSYDIILLGKEELDTLDILNWNYTQENVKEPEAKSMESNELNLDYLISNIFKFGSGI